MCAKEPLDHNLIGDYWSPKFQYLNILVKECIETETESCVDDSVRDDYFSQSLLHVWHSDSNFINTRFSAHL